MKRSIVKRRGPLVITGALLIIGMGTPAAKADVDDIDVEVGEPLVISRSTGYHWFPTLKRVDWQKLLVSFWCSYDEISPETTRTAHCVTSDGGLTWSEPVRQGDAGHSWERLQDGTCLWLSYQTIRESDTICSCRVGRSLDGVEYHWATGAVNVAPMKLTHGPKGTAGLVFARSIVEMPTGNLLATMYGRFEGDAADRSIVVRSTDGGMRWRYLSTIGYDPSIGGEGLNEPCMVQVSRHELVCVMRNASGEPLWLARSFDAGESWTGLQQVADRALGVFPDLVLMSNGLLACSFGRPGCRLMFSPDGRGETWSEPVTIFDGPSTCYTAIREVEPGKLLYIHDVIPGGWQNKLQEGQFNEIRGVYVTVRPK